MSEEEKKAIEYFEEKIKNKLPLYIETYIDGKPYRRNLLQLETNFTEEQANKTKILLNLIEKQQKEIERLQKYDYRNIKIEEKNKISSIHFTKEQLDLMNLGIALYVGIPKILTDTEDEETDI